ncbi:PRAME family member 12-like [Tenrec ecaudatus]|uniref:PRAME family member 12-like n=1 Tax=Tenrec ecaudatus TaxID=94439 RepID=UPI003F591C91
MVKTLVGTWPFIRLPLGALVKSWESQQDTLKAALHGLDILLPQEVTPKRWKLRVLDLQPDADSTFWDVWSGAEADPGTRTQNGDPARRGEKYASLAGPAVVVTNLCFQKMDRDELLSFLTERVLQRKNLPHLCCTKLEFRGPANHHPIVLERILNMVQLDCVREVEVNCRWDLHYLNWFAPYLAQMGHLDSLHLSGIRLGCRWFCSKDEADERLAQLTSQLSRLRPLQQLTLRFITFCRDQLDQLLSCMPTPLESLIIMDCLLYFSDITRPSLCPCLHQVRSMDLSGVCKVGLDHSFFPLLIYNASATLTHLDLADCNIHDSDLRALQPALGRCSQLSTLLLCGNPVSTAALQSLLQQIVPLCKFSLVELPVPPQCYVGPAQFLHVGRLAWVMEQLRLSLPGPRVLSLNFAQSPDCLIYDAILLRGDD